MDTNWDVIVLQDITGEVPLPEVGEKDEREKEERDEREGRGTSAPPAAVLQANTAYGVAVVVGGAVLLLILLLFLSKNFHCCPVDVRGRKKKDGRGDVQESEVSGDEEAGGESVEPPESGSLDSVVVQNEARREVQHPLADRSAETEEVQPAYSLGT